MPRIRYEEPGTGGGGSGAVDSVSESGSTPLTISPTTGDVLITMDQATTSSDGYLSSTDWNTFNDKADSDHTHLKIGDDNTYILVTPASNKIEVYVNGTKIIEWS